ncbi:MAG: type II toxin-antitoxin system PemK/MazF family toxin [bacterium]|nr:type II toxin-antitoxin system PemK/MazF family toxin [bacterium]
MKKDFQKWHSKKAKVDEIEKRPFFHEREIWFCHLGVNVGFEQDGSGEEFLRPIVIIKKFSNEVFWAIPLTKTEKKTQFYFPFFIGSESEASVAILSQIRLTDGKRLSYKIGDMAESDFLLLKEKLKALLP